jgi:molybdopterin synthase catalytic subunit
MKALRVVGPSESGRTALVERLVERLSERGRVGTVAHLDSQEDIDLVRNGNKPTAGAARTYSIGDDGEWVGTGDERTLTDVLDRLAIDCDYAVVDGAGNSTLPTVALGETDADDVIAAAQTAEDVDIDAVVDALTDRDPYETLESLVAQVKRSPRTDRSGAIATFTGRVRPKEEPDDDPTEYLEFERYDDVAAEKMRAIRDELTDRDGVYEVLLHHKTGVVDAGEDIVFVVVLAGHRQEAFETVEDGINRLKDEVPLFKKEVTVSDEFWAHQHET